ncbi:YdiL family protein [Ancylobacter sp. Lp-2]|uniref:helix-turn-helix domain-containing protein n=1 Tax=Ancylobacter sp. Lp-2 TaxID=2881339 RepID=UPI001E3A8535|nr:YdiL family protein [Ancylobacter sp. Lp-2]MCB4771510.1 YdiL family protein [Ancylobacter sp. Lp-2]
MTPTELQSALARLDLSPAALAKLLGVDVRTARRWATGGKPIPDNVAAQLTAMVLAGGVPTELVERRPKVEDEEITRFQWVRRQGEQEWTVAEHDLIADVFYLPGRVERYTASELVLGPTIEVPEA